MLTPLQGEDARSICVPDASLLGKITYEKCISVVDC